MQQYETEFKQKIVRLHLEEGRTLNSLSDEYGVSKASISIWVKSYREECQLNHYRLKPIGSKAAKAD